MTDRLHVVELDATKDETVKKAIEHVLAKEDHIDAVINNAGAGWFGPVESFSDADLQAQFDINVFGN